MTREEFIFTAHSILPYSFEGTNAALDRAFAASPDKRAYTPHDVQALDLAIRLSGASSELSGIVMDEREIEALSDPEQQMTAAQFIDEAERQGFPRRLAELVTQHSEQETYDIADIDSLGILDLVITPDRYDDPEIHKTMQAIFSVFDGE